jgi:hypothetical protein
LYIPAELGWREQQPGTHEGRDLSLGRLRKGICQKPQP